MRRWPAVALATGAALLGACGADGAGTGSPSTVVADPGPSVEIAIEQPAATQAPQSGGVLSVAPTDEAAGATSSGSDDTDPSAGAGTGAGSGQPAATVGATPSGPARASTGPATSVVAHAAVAEVVAYREPTDQAEAVTSLVHPTPLGTPLVFLVVDGAQSAADWVQVQLPIQPNGTTGWVRRADVELYANPYRIEIDRSAHRLWVYERGRLWIEAPIAVGTGATPTPVGEFYLLELLAAPDPTGPYGPYAFGLSGFSEVLETFGGADSAVIGLHGTNDPSALGTDVSFGCIRLANDVIEQLAATLPLGTPVDIV